jgi:hypothetical protein
MEIRLSITGRRHAGNGDADRDGKLNDASGKSSGVGVSVLLGQPYGFEGIRLGREPLQAKDHSVAEPNTSVSANSVGA